MIAAATATPCTVRALAERAQVAYGAANWTAFRLVQRGQLVTHGYLPRPSGGGRRPMLVALPSPDARTESAVDLAAALMAWRAGGKAGESESPTLGIASTGAGA